MTPPLSTPHAEPGTFRALTDLLAMDAAEIAAYLKAGGGEPVTVCIPMAVNEESEKSA